jgi:DNA/RNA-binding domain of Phe-tRNA-synthetase-like protein
VTDVSFQLHPQVCQDFPEAQIRLVTALSLRNDQPWDNVAKELAQLELHLADNQWRPFDKEHPTIKSWHTAYRRFGTNPNRTRPSVDALSRRLTRDGRLPRISPAVDAYNLVSVRFGTPAGAFDLDRTPSQVTIKYGAAGDVFVPLGKPDVTEEPGTSEVVYAGGSTVLTRFWNHRDAELTKVTEQSRNVVFMIERISASAVPDSAIAEAQETLVDLLLPHADTVTGSVLVPG